MKRIIITCSALIALSACSSVSKIKTTDVDYIRKTGVLAHPLLAEVEVKNEKVKGEYLMKTASYTVNPKYGKNMAIADAIEKSNADYLVHPMYEIEKGSSKTTIKVTGYPGVYKEFRKIVPADSTVLKLGQAIPVNSTSGMIEIEVIDPKDAKKANRKKKK